MRSPGLRRWRAIPETRNALLGSDVAHCARLAFFAAVMLFDRADGAREAFNRCEMAKSVVVVVVI
jgi:hypothetical protein